MHNTFFEARGSASLLRIVKTLLCTIDVIDVAITIASILRHTFSHFPISEIPMCILIYWYI